MSLGPPPHRNRSADEILGEKLYFDSAGYLFRAISWLDHFHRNPRYTTLLYACIEGRMGIEYLLFEELVMSTGAKLSREDYERSLKDRNSFTKPIRQLNPDHEKAQEFTRAVAEIEPSAPSLIFWRPRDLEKAWGKLSKHLHWGGARTEAADDPQWLDQAYRDVKQVLVPIWEMMLSGSSSLFHPDSMKPAVREIWVDFKDGKIDAKSVKARLELIRYI